MTRYLELLAKLDSLTCCSGAHELALRAVVELHHPEFWPSLNTTYCVGCKDQFYPCPTIQGIDEVVSHGR
jgi:hypothetical protein